MKKLIPYILAVVVLSSCEKEDVPVILPPPGDMRTMVANMGINYDNQVFVDFETGNQKVVSYKAFDLAFEASASGYRVYLNTAKYMFLTNTLSTNIATADSTGLQWKTETDNLEDDSTAFGNWLDASQQSLNHVYVIDRGRPEHFGAARWRKFQLLWVTPTEYRIRFSMYDNTQLTELTIPKNQDYSLMYFSFDNGGTIVDVAPRRNDWDLVFTKFIHTYHSEPLTSPFRYYLVSGALLNRWSDNGNEIVKQDSTPGFKPFESVTASDMGTFTFTKDAAKIGFMWKDYDFDLGYIIYNDRFYLLSDPSGYYYKIKFIDFYDSQGNKGAATFEYQRL